MEEKNIYLVFPTLLRDELVIYITHFIYIRVKKLIGGNLKSHSASCLLRHVSYLYTTISIYLLSYGWCTLLVILIR